MRGRARPIDLDAAGVTASKPTATSATKREAFRRTLAHLPVRAFRSWGVPFRFTGAPRILGAGDLIEVPVHARATFLVLATCCAPVVARADTDGPIDDDARMQAELDAVGEILAELSMDFEDGSHETVPIRRRFETAPPAVDWGRQPYLARAHREDGPLDPAGPYDVAGWGYNQSAVEQGTYDAPIAWLAAIENPHPERTITVIRLAGAASLVAIAGITTWVEPSRPLAARTEMHLAIDGPVSPGAVAVIDGTLIRSFFVDPPERRAWLADRGLRGFGSAVAPIRRLIVELAGTDGTRIRVGRRSVGLEGLLPGASRTVGPTTVTRLALPSIPVRMRIIESGRTVAGRIHVRAADGRELAPTDRGRFVSNRWFEDRGADVVVGGWRYAYVTEEFEVLAPNGDLFVEVARGPEYEILHVVQQVGEPGSVDLEPRRVADMRAAGWLASDSHVHFVHPRALHRQALAEGLQLVHLMGAQWGELYTNVEDLAEGPAASSDDAVVWTGTENRHHAMGHVLAIGTPSVRPLASGGPGESRIGDPNRVTIADWADQTRATGGLAILAHLPDPYLEVVADLLLGRFDAIELWFWPTLDGHRTREWYRFLNLGLRIPLMSGTDKMFASTVVGSVRTYTFTGGQEIDFGAWAGAVRTGRTMVSTGPLLEFTIDDLLPGSTLGNQGTHACRWRIRSAVPVGTFEIVVNGSVAHRVILEGTGPWFGSLDLPHPDRGWIAARCSGPDILTGTRTPLPFQIGAHTSPIYLPEPAVPDQAQLEYIRTLLDGAEGWGRLATWEADEIRARFETLVTDARSVLG